MNTAEPIIIERILNAPVSKVWKAIIDRDQMKQWYFDLAEFKVEVGFEFSFWGGTKDKQYLHLCKITEVIHEKKLSYSWRYDTYEGDSLVTFELFPEGNNTKIRLIHTGIESFPNNDPNFARSSFTAGWTHIVNISLKEYVEITAKF